MLRIFLFAALISSFCQAEEAYQRFVESIAYTHEAGNTLALIRLSDGSTWNFSVEAKKESLLADLEEDLSIGKEVFIQPNNTTLFYRLFVALKVDYMGYLVGMTKETKQQIPNRIVSQKKYTIKEGGWFTNPVYGYQIGLTDGSLWDVNETARRQWVLDEWKEGNKVIVTKTIGDEWSLINVNAPYQDNYDNDYRWLLNVTRLSQ